MNLAEIFCTIILTVGLAMNSKCVIDQAQEQEAKNSHTCHSYLGKIGDGHLP